LDTVRNLVSFHDASNRDAKRRPGELNQPDHGCWIPP
jgi:hypothetical protein